MPHGHLGLLFYADMVDCQVVCDFVYSWRSAVSAVALLHVVPERVAFPG